MSKQSKEKDGKQKVQIHGYVATDIYKKIERLAEKRDHSRSKVVSGLVADALKGAR